MNVISEEFREFSTATLSDCLDDLGVRGVILGFSARVLPARRVAGRVYTAKFEPITGEARDRAGGTVGMPLQTVLQRMEPEHVLLMDLGGRLDVAVWGNLASEIARRKSMVGTLIHGCCRDVDELQRVRYPVYSLGLSPRRSRNTMALAGLQVPLEIQGVPVAPGDFIVADATGVVVIAAARVAEVIVRAREIRQTERAVEEGIRAGDDLSQLWPSV